MTQQALAADRVTQPAILEREIRAINRLRENTCVGSDLWLQTQISPILDDDSIEFLREVYIDYLIVYDSGYVEEYEQNLSDGIKLDSEGKVQTVV